MPQIAKYGIDIQIVRPEMTKFKMFREKVNMDFYFVGIKYEQSENILRGFLILFLRKGVASE
jgi:hypothetical protein